MKLSETIEMMMNGDYKERFRAEYHQLSIRLEKLIDLLDSGDRGVLPELPACHRELLEAQAHAMRVYLGILKLRAEVEGVEL